MQEDWAAAFFVGAVGVGHFSDATFVVAGVDVVDFGEGVEFRVDEEVVDGNLAK